MSDRPAKSFQDEVLGTVVKSGATGVAATILAVAIFSPAGLGGMIGTSLASGAGVDPNSAPADDVYANLPAYPAPLSQDELTEIRGQIARSTASLEITRAATEERIELVRTLANSQGDLNAAQVVRLTQGDDLRLETTAPAELTPVAAPVGGEPVAYNDRHAELANLLLAHENF